MLTRLVLHNLVIVERVELDFDDGFCVLTGETGAGKSLLVGALTLLAGARATAALIRPGHTHAEIEASFTLAADDPLRQHLQDNHLAAADHEDDSGTLLARRVISSTRSAAYLNGRQVPLAQLADIMARHLDICGQHAHYSLQKNSAHRHLLDTYAAADTNAVAAAHRRWRDACDRHDTAAAQADAADKTRAMLEETLAELNALAFTPEKWRDMNATLTRTATLSDLADGSARLLQLLEGEESGNADSRGARPAIAQARRQLTELARHDPTLAAHTAALDDAESLLADLARDIARYADGLAAEPEKQAQAEEFIAACHRAARKYGIGDAAHLDAHIADQQAALDALPTAADVADLARQAAEARADLDAHCKTLTTQRRRAAKTLCKEVNTLLTDLAMPKAALSVQLTQHPAPTATGAEKVAFQISTRAGMPPGDIGDIASGGELSRLGLAIQLAAGRVRDRAVSVFDEVDAGVGGAAAGVIGALLRRLGGSRQVLCVTHLPQVAAQAHRHWRVIGGDTLAVQPLTADERVEEIARMQSGETITKTARQHAREMLQANTPKKQQATT